MKITNYYINSDKQTEQYQNLCKAVSSSQNFQKNIKGLNIDKKDIDLYLSYLFLENTTQLNLYIRQMLSSSSPDINRNASIKILNTMSNQLLNPTKTTYTFAKLHNKNFKNFPTQVIDYANPMVITIQQIEEEFDVNKNSDIELYAKNMLWSSRLAKHSEVIRRSIVEKSCPNVKNAKELFECTKIYDKFKNHLLVKLSNDNEPISEAYLQDYSSYLYGDIENKEELKKTDSYKYVAKMLKNNSKFTSKYNITPDSLFKYMACAESTINLYEIKHKCIDLIVQEYAKSNKSNNIQIFRHIDANKKNEKNDSDFIVSLPQYNTDFKVHADSKFLDDLEKKYDITLTNAKVSTPFIPYMVYRYTPLQKKQISTLAQSNVSYKYHERDFLDYEIARFNSNKHIDKGGKEDYAR